MTHILRRPAAMAAIAVFVILAAVLSSPPAEDASAGGSPVLQPPFDNDYTLTNIGMVPGTFGNLGALAFLQNEPDLLLAGYHAADSDGALNAITVIRDADGHITGFSGDPQFFANAPEIDGGADYAPNGVLMVTTYGSTATGNLILQYKPGSSEPDKTTDLATIGIPGSVGALRFVPPGFPGAGQLKVISYDEDAWYTVSFAEDGGGAYNLSDAGQKIQLAAISGPESPVYVSTVAPQFGFPGILLAEYARGEIGAYTADVNGDPIPGSRRTFIGGGGFSPDGMVRDPVTGDVIIGDYDTGEVYVVSGFASLPSKGDLNCDALIGALDVVVFFRHQVDAPLAQPPGCPEIGEPFPGIQVAGLIIIIGDINCDGTLTEADGLELLKYAGDLPNNLPGFCPPIGASP